MLKEAWETKEDTEESVVLYVLTFQERLQKMRELVTDNQDKTQKKQKRWYDQKTHSAYWRQGASSPPNGVKEVICLLARPLQGGQEDWQSQLPS